jgi:hypothetical protein
MTGFPNSTNVHYLTSDDRTSAAARRLRRAEAKLGKDVVCFVKALFEIPTPGQPLPRLPKKLERLILAVLREVASRRGEIVPFSLRQ